MSGLASAKFIHDCERKLVNLTDEVFASLFAGRSQTQNSPQVIA